MADYRITRCNFCGTTYKPRSSREKHCSWQCRFKEIAAKFSGDECWEWPLSMAASGYGQFNAGSNIVTAHRASYRLFVGDIPEGMFICHKCDNKKCFNPAHLFAGTPKDNIVDMWNKGRQQDYKNIVSGDDHPRRKNPSLWFSKYSIETKMEMARKAATSSRRKVALEYGCCHSVVNAAVRKFGSLQKSALLAQK